MFSLQLATEFYRLWIEVLIVKIVVNIRGRYLSSIINKQTIFQVINFYFNLLMDRSKKCAPTIHIFNTFFYPRLLKVGHQGLARWTRKVLADSHDKIDTFIIDIWLLINSVIINCGDFSKISDRLLPYRLICSQWIWSWFQYILECIGV